MLSNLLRLVEDDTAALRQNRDRGQCLKMRPILPSRSANPKCFRGSMIVRALRNDAYANFNRPAARSRNRKFPGVRIAKP